MTWTRQPEEGGEGIGAAGGCCLASRRRALAELTVGEAALDGERARRLAWDSEPRRAVPVTSSLHLSSAALATLPSHRMTHADRKPRRLTETLRRYLRSEPLWI